MAVHGLLRAENLNGIISNTSRKEVFFMANTLGSWDISALKSCNLPQKAASAFTAVTGGLVGAEYMPVLYVGSQQVRGTNHCIIAVQTLVTSEPEKRLVKMILNEGTDNPGSIVSISGITLL